MTAEGERIAALEAKTEAAEHQRDDIIDRLDDQDADLRAIRINVEEINKTLSAYKGFWAGAGFVLTMFGGAIGAMLATFWHRITGH
jgi:hypothetical protein